jgi:hypothetical protein
VSDGAVPPSTDALIARLSGDLVAVRRLPPPPLRAAGWIALATVLAVGLALLRGLRPDLALRLGDPAYLVQLGGAWLTGVTATLAAFEISLPDRRSSWLLLPLPAALLWASGFAYGCLGHWVAIPAGAPVMADSMRCLETIGMATVPLAPILWLMLRRARPLRPGGTAWAGALAVAGFVDLAHLLAHQVEASLLVLLINLVPVGLILAVGGLAGSRRLDTAAAASG